MNITQQYLTPHYLEAPEDVLAYLADSIRAIHAALDHGISLADSKMSDIEPDASLWAHHVRHEARCRLAKEKVDGWELSNKRLPNSGIQVVCMPLLVRVLKSQNNGPPHPGHSKARRQYFSQSTLAPGLPLVFGRVVMPPGPNFVLDWALTIRTTK